MRNKIKNSTVNNENSRNSVDANLLRLQRYLNESDYNVDRALFRACTDGHSDAILQLLHQRANARARDQNNSTPLHSAAISGSDDAIAVLLEVGVDVNAVDNNRWQPLHWAAYFDRCAVIQQLIDSGADLHAENQLNQTPVAIARARNYLNAASILELAEFNETQGAKQTSILKDSTKLTKTASYR